MCKIQPGAEHDQNSAMGDEVAASLSALLEAARAPLLDAVYHRRRWQPCWAVTIEAPLGQEGINNAVSICATLNLPPLPFSKLRLWQQHQANHKQAAPNGL